MGRRQVWCVFGTFQQDYDAIDLARACDFAFIPLYTRAGQDTLLDDSHADVQKMLAMVPRFPRTNFAISFPHGRIADVMAHLRGSSGQNKLQNYWSRNIFHHAVLDLEVKPWQNRSIQNEVSAVFNLLRVLRDRQRDLNGTHPSARAPSGGFIILGVRIWPANEALFLGNVSQHLERFPVEGLIPWTHFTEDEFAAGYPECIITGASPRNSTNNNNTVSIFQALDWVQNSTSWNIYPSVAMSLTLCTRVYMTSTQATAQFGDTCVNAGTPPGTSDTYCNDPMKLYLNFSIMAQETAYAVPPNFTEYLSVFEVIYTATLKLCEVRRRYGANVSLALFDIECEDWRNACSSTDSQIVAGANRIRRIYDYSEHLTHTFIQSDPGCP
ncbi:uncharacterized protein LOC144118731 [Amblyomma americanum]